VGQNNDFVGQRQSASSQLSRSSRTSHNANFKFMVINHAENTKIVWFGVTEVTWWQMKDKLRIANSTQKAFGRPTKGCLHDF
jgi:hypothetical protein